MFRPDRFPTSTTLPRGDNKSRSMSSPVAVNSSSLCSVQYLPEQQLLTVRFRSSQTDSYSYSRVPLRLYTELLAAESKGRYFNTYIRNCFSCSQTTPD